MPIYVYQCDGCSKIFEVFQRHTDPPPAEHACGSTQVRRILSNTSFVLKGTGWYATDYAARPAGGGEGGDAAKLETPTSAGAGDAGAGESATQGAAGGAEGSGAKKKKDGGSGSGSGGSGGSGSGGDRAEGGGGRGSTGGAGSPAKTGPAGGGTPRP